MLDVITQQPTARLERLESEVRVRGRQWVKDVDVCLILISSSSPPRHEIRQEHSEVMVHASVGQHVGNMNLEKDFRLVSAILIHNMRMNAWPGPTTASDWNVS